MMESDLIAYRVPRDARRTVTRTISLVKALMNGCEQLCLLCVDNYDNDNEIILLPIPVCGSFSLWGIKFCQLGNKTRTTTKCRK